MPEGTRDIVHEQWVSVERKKKIQEQVNKESLGKTIRKWSHLRKQNQESLGSLQYAISYFVQIQGTNQAVYHRHIIKTEVLIIPHESLF